MTISIRATEPADHEAVLECVRAAFATRGRDGEEEVAIVRETWLRGDAAPGLDLVATSGAETVGHVLGGRGRLGAREVVGLAPLAVRPDFQRQGVGSSLVREFLARADELGRPLVVLLGNPAYYSRFGFEPAGPLGISYATFEPGDPHFQVARLGSYDPSWRGEFKYCWELER